MTLPECDVLVTVTGICTTETGKRLIINLIKPLCLPINSLFVVLLEGWCGDVCVTLLLVTVVMMVSGDGTGWRMNLTQPPFFPRQLWDLAQP